MCQCDKTDWKNLQKGLWSSVMSPYDEQYIDVKFSYHLHCRRADEWDVNKWAWEGALKVVSKGEECIIKLVDKTTGELTAMLEILDKLGYKDDEGVTNESWLQGKGSAYATMVLKSTVLVLLTPSITDVFLLQYTRISFTSVLNDNIPSPWPFLLNPQPLPDR